MNRRDGIRLIAICLAVCVTAGVHAALPRPEPLRPMSQEAIPNVTYEPPAAATVLDASTEELRSADVQSACSGEARGTLVYNNLVNGPTSSYWAAPGTEIGDALQMTGSGVLDDLRFTVYNSSTSAGPLHTANLLVRLYNYEPAYSTYVFAGGVTFSGVTLNLAPGYYTVLTAADLAEFGILLNQRVLATLTISGVTGGADRVGQVFFNPPVIGTSTDDFFSAGGWYWFSGNPVANFGWAIGTEPGYGAAGAVVLDEFIARVQLTNIDNSPTLPNGSGLALGGYSNFTSLVANLGPGGSYPLVVRLESGWSGDIVTAWFDWNHDGDFGDANEQLNLSGSALSYNGMVTVPPSALSGPTRMRVRVQDGYFNPTRTPYGYTAYGEVEDYTVDVGPRALALEPTKTCYRQGDQVVVEIVLNGNNTEVLAGLLFLSYSDKLALVSAAPGDAPFTDEVAEHVDAGAHTIDYTVGVPTPSDPHTPASGYRGADPVVLARLTFDILANDCNLADAVAWRTPAAPFQTRLSQLVDGQSVPLVPDGLDPLAAIRLDITPPVLNVPGAAAVACLEDSLPGVPYGTATGGVAIYYNNNGHGEDITNQAYYKYQFSASHPNTGAAFLFDNAPLVGNGLLNWQLLYSGLPWPDSQFGFDLVVPAPTADGTVLPPLLLAYDNGNNDVSGRVLRGPVTWAINDYKPHAPNIAAGQVLNSIVSSALQTTPGVPNGNDLFVFRNQYSHAGSVYTAYTAGALVSDGVHHWYNPVTPDSPMSNYNLNGAFFFSGTLTYDAAHDPYPLMDFYSGTLQLTANYPSTAVGFATATDNCTLFPTIWYEDTDDGGDGCPGAPLIITRTWYAQDECGNVSSGVQTITVIDDVPPEVLNCPAPITVSNDPGNCSAVVAWETPQAWDNCDGVLIATPTHASGSTFPVGVTTVAYTYVDSCGNSTPCSFTVTVVDDEPPTVTCPADVTVNADAGLCTASGVELGTPATHDNCGVLSVTNDAPAIFNTGTTTVTWTVRDVHGNTATCTQDVTVNALNDLLVTVQIQGDLLADVTRCVTFTFIDCDDELNPVVFQRDLTFAELTGIASAAFTVANGDGLDCGAYDCVLVQDELHTLTRRLPIASPYFSVNGAHQYVINATGAVQLLQGDLYDDTADVGVDFIDIVDIGVYIAEWGSIYDSDGNGVPDGDTPCGHYAVHADINGDAAIDTSDRGFITTNYLRVGESSCCSKAVSGGVSQPRTSITTAELRALGLARVARRADLNGDGVVDATDVMLFNQGARPLPDSVSYFPATPRPATAAPAGRSPK